MQADRDQDYDHLKKAFALRHRTPPLSANYESRYNRIAITHCFYFTRMSPLGMGPLIAGRKQYELNKNRSATHLQRVADFRSAHMMEYGAYCAMI
jgi:hypothetical protein